MQKHISAAEAVPVRVVIVTLDGHLSGTVERVAQRLRKGSYPGLELSLQVASDWDRDPRALARCTEAIARADIILATMLFMEDHIRAVLPAIKARQEKCDAVVACIAASEVVAVTRLGRLRMDREQTGILGMLKKLRGSSGKTEASSNGSRQMRMLRRLPKILKYVPGKAQDLRAYFLIMQYWLAGSDENVESMIRFLIDGYADGPRRALRGAMTPPAPVEYPEVGLYHPRMPGRFCESRDSAPAGPDGCRGTIGLLLMRSYLLAGNTAHYDAVIASFEQAGYRVLPAFASGLDARPAIERFFLADGRSAIDGLVSLTGFSLVGGPAYSDAAAAEKTLSALDVPLVSAIPIEFQSLEEWSASPQGLLPVEATMMVAIPELEGATTSQVFAGRTSRNGNNSRDMAPCTERVAMLVDRVTRMIALRQTERSQRRLAIVLFNFPPNAGATGTAAYLSVFESLFNTLGALAAAGYRVDLPATVDDLRSRILEGNAQHLGTNANVMARIAADDHIRRETWLGEIEAQWGRAPGRHQSDGASIQILGARFGNIAVCIQPAFGYEGDPMRLLFERGFAPTHAFSAFYRWIKEDLAAHAVLHFGTHGALEFMPGKQAGLDSGCWPDRLIGALPNFYLYAANNPSEGMLAKRRASATLISYLTPSISHAGLYRGLLDVKATLVEWRQLEPSQRPHRPELLELLQVQAAAVDLAETEPAWRASDDARITRLGEAILELEYTLIPHGLHVFGAAMPASERVDTLAAIAEAGIAPDCGRAAIETLVGEQDHGATAKPSGSDAGLDALKRIDSLLSQDHELPAIVAALDGRYVRPAAGGDLIRTPDILPTGRNIHGFDPFRIPTAAAVADGARQAELLLARHMSEGHAMPETIAFVLWGSDNLKSGGGPVAQVLALMGAKPHFDSYGRLCGAELIPLSELRRPRVDVIVTVSGIFRDLLPLQSRLIAEAAYLAATADEPEDRNFVRKHALAHQRETGCDAETAALRVFGNADGAYGSNVNHLIESGRWDKADELADTFSRRKGFAYDRRGTASAQSALLRSVLSKVELTYQNLESVELGVTTIDTYFDTLGGVSGAVQQARGGQLPPVYIGDQTRGEGRVRSLNEQIALESRTRMLNPKWYEGMLKHGYEGVRQIEAHVTNTVGWSATTGQVDGWVYQRISETYVLDTAMRDRLSALNPTASARMAHRLIEAHERRLWTPEPETLAALLEAGEMLDDRLEGITSKEMAA